MPVAGTNAVADAAPSERAGLMIGAEDKPIELASGCEARARGRGARARCWAAAPVPGRGARARRLGAVLGGCAGACAGVTRYRPVSRRRTARAAPWIARVPTKPTTAPTSPTVSAELVES